MTDGYVIEQIFDDPEADTAKYHGRWQVAEAATGAAAGAVLKNRRWDPETQIDSCWYTAILGGVPNPFAGEKLGTAPTVDEAIELLIAHLREASA